MNSEKEDKQADEDKQVFRKILENYEYLNKMMVEEIDIASTHGGTTGNYREEMWMKFFRSIIPLKYSLAQGVIIIDSNNNCSREVDIAIYDEQYVPYVFQFNTLKFIPIEAVVVAIECKSKDWDDDKVGDWADSIKTLQTRKTGIARMVQGYVTGITNLTQKNTRPILIFASNVMRTREKTIDDITKMLEKHFDFILLKKAEEGSNGAIRRFELKVPNEDKKLGWWGSQLNGMTPASQEKVDPDDIDLEVIGKNISLTEIEKDITDGCYTELEFCEANKRHLENKLEGLKIPDNPLLTLNFQLNQLLMLINNPMLFPHYAYASAFRKVSKNIEIQNINPKKS